MAKKTNKQTIERQIAAYPSIKVWRMFIVDMTDKMRSKSGHAKIIISKHYEGMSDAQQKDLLSRFEKINYEPRKRDKK